MINIAPYFKAEDRTSCSSAANPIFSSAALMAPFTLSYSPVKHLGPGKWFQTPQILLIIQSRRRERSLANTGSWSLMSQSNYHPANEAAGSLCGF